MAGLTKIRSDSRSKQSVVVTWCQPGLLFLLAAACIVPAALLVAAHCRPVKAQGSEASRGRAAEYQSVVPKTVVELQQFRTATSSRVRTDSGSEGVATLVNLNPTSNAWYLLQVTWLGQAEITYHLENSEPRSRKVFLDDKYPFGVEIVQGKMHTPCDLFRGASPNLLEQARTSQLIYAPLCDGRLYLRNPARGYRTTLESAAEFLRSQVWGGEKVVVLFHHLFEDTHRETGKLSGDEHPGQGTAHTVLALDPLPAQIDAKYAGRFLSANGLAIALENIAPNGMRPGVWYPARNNPGVFVSLIEPEVIDTVILTSYKTRVNPLDRVEAPSLCYLVAFDLDQFDLAYALGTDHPAVTWSTHIQNGIKNEKLPGPDGIGTVSPLVSTGLIIPENARRTVATFSGGFKREHGAFKFGDLARKNYGSHYGFIENGVVFSKLQPDLATILVFADGSVQMKTWKTEDDRSLEEIRYARQNGVPIVEFDSASGTSVPGPLVNRWGPGNWSGSEDSKLRAIRSGAAMQWNGKKHFLIYAVFSDATPSAMARVFQAYRCRYAMLLDMNALEHTYLAMYRRAGDRFAVDHLIDGMSEVDKVGANGPIPRFLGYPDNRDFFYVMRRSVP